MKKAFVISLMIAASIVLFLSKNLYKKCISPACSSTSSAEIAQDILPIEDLMREHGVLNRLLLIYEEIIRRQEHKEPFPMEQLSKTIILIKTFIEDYHEKLEKTYIFPLFEKKQLELELVKTLRAQHESGRIVTNKIKQLIASQKPDLAEISRLMKEFITMYRPHEAREDTELFPKIHDLVTAQEFRALGKKFEDREEELFGKNGFEKIVSQVAALEKELGIYQLDQFTPH